MIRRKKAILERVGGEGFCVEITFEVRRIGWRVSYIRVGGVAFFDGFC